MAEKEICQESSRGQRQQLVTWNEKCYLYISIGINTHKQCIYIIYIYIIIVRFPNHKNPDSSRFHFFAWSVFELQISPQNGAEHDITPFIVTTCGQPEGSSTLQRHWPQELYWMRSYHQLTPPLEFRHPYLQLFDTFRQPTSQNPEGWQVQTCAEAAMLFSWKKKCRESNNFSQALLNGISKSFQIQQFTVSTVCTHPKARAPWQVQTCAEAAMLLIENKTCRESNNFSQALLNGISKSNNLQ